MGSRGGGESPATREGQPFSANQASSFLGFSLPFFLRRCLPPRVHSLQYFLGQARKYEKNEKNVTFLRTRPHPSHHLYRHTIPSPFLLSFFDSEKPMIVLADLIFTNPFYARGCYPPQTHSMPAGATRPLRCHPRAKRRISKGTPEKTVTVLGL